jgi:hypothetical protein
LFAKTVQSSRVEPKKFVYVLRKFFLLVFRFSFKSPVNNFFMPTCDGHKMLSWGQRIVEIGQKIVRKIDERPCNLGNYTDLKLAT